MYICCCRQILCTTWNNYVNHASCHCHCSSIATGRCMLRKLSNKHTDHRHHSQSATIGVPSCCILRSSHCKLAVSRLATISALTLFSSTTGLPLMKSTAMTELVFHVCVHACMCERISNPYMRVLLPVTVSSFQEMYVHYNTCTHTLQKQVATEWLPWLQTNWRNNGYRGLLW